MAPALLVTICCNFRQMPSTRASQMPVHLIWAFRLDPRGRDSTGTTDPAVRARNRNHLRLTREPEQDDHRPSGDLHEADWSSCGESSVYLDSSGSESSRSRMQVQRFQTGTNRVYLHIVKQRVGTAATNGEVAKKRSVTVVPHLWAINMIIVLLGQSTAASSSRDSFFSSFSSFSCLSSVCDSNGFHECIE